MPPKGERRKQQIINTAKEMFIEKGFQSTHIGQVCEKLNIARGTVYQYFSNKKEILFALLDLVIDNIEDILDPDDLTDFLASEPDQNATSKFVKNRLSSSMDVLVSEPIVIKLIYKEISGIDSEVIRRVNGSIQKIKNIISGEIAELQKRRVFNNEIDPDITSSMLVGGIMMIIYEFDKKKKDVLNDKIIQSIVENYLYGTLSL